jgi:glycosyltransferase involved in cell wall biosynthesis
MRGLAFRGAAQVVSVSSVGAAGIEERYPGLAVRVIPDALADFAVDETEVAKIRARWPGKVLLGNVAALDHAVKGQLTLIEAARRAAQERPEWQFVICGEGRDRQRFEEAIEGLSNVALVGWVDNVGDWLSSFDVFVFPSLDEALGSTLLDAMQVGLPIVASKVGGIPDVVEDGVNGRLVEPEDAEALYAAIDGLLADDEALAAIRARNIEKSQSFSATHMADAYETLYREIAPSM